METPTVHLTIEELQTIIASTFFQYAREDDDSYKRRIKSVHKKLSKYVNMVGYTVPIKLEE